MATLRLIGFLLVTVLFFRSTVAQGDFPEDWIARTVQTNPRPVETTAPPVTATPPADTDVTTPFTTHYRSSRHLCSLLSESLARTRNQITSALNGLQTKIEGTYEQIDHVAANVKELSTKLDGIGLCKNAPTVLTSCKAYYDAGNRTSGVYPIRIGPDVENVSCDMTTDGGGWTVFQRRQDGSVDFYRNWADYRNGFGNVKGEFWLGNRFIHLLTVGGRELRVDFDGDRHLKFRNFSVSSENDKFRLSVSGPSGNVGDMISHHNGAQFTTKDQDNDALPQENCAQKYIGAYWYQGCYWSNLNGRYGIRGSYRALLWGNIYNGFYPSFVEMKLR